MSNVLEITLQRESGEITTEQMLDQLLAVDYTVKVTNGKEHYDQAGEPVGEKKYLGYAYQTGLITRDEYNFLRSFLTYTATIELYSTKVAQELMRIALKHNTHFEDVVAWLYQPTTYLDDDATPIDYIETDPGLVIQAARRAWGTEW